MIIFNGISSDEIGVIVEHYPTFIVPKRRYNVIEVPGRNGDLVIDQGAYANYEQPYEVFLDAKDRGELPAVVQKLSRWLAAGGGYCKLEDSYSPNTYRMAYIENDLEFSNYFNIYGKGTLIFKCMPQRYLKSGAEEILVQHQVEDQENNKLITAPIYNPTEYLSDPVIRFQGYGVSSITAIRDGNTVGTIEISLRSRSSSDIYVIDVANHKFTQNGKAAMEGFSGRFEDLKLGKETYFELKNDAGYVSHIYIKITPNWWIL